MTIDLDRGERDVAGFVWCLCQEEPWIPNVLLADATLDFGTAEAERGFIEVLEGHEDEWLQALVDPLAPQEERARARVGVNLLRRLTS